MSDLTAFLGARIDDDALSAHCGRWWGAVDAIVALHTAGPLLDHYEHGCTCGFRDHRFAVCNGCGWRIADEGEYHRPSSPCLTLRLLASGYSDHPDFDPAWASA